MKAWKELEAVAIPDRVARLAKDARGYPIPYSVWFNELGLPDFRVVDPQKWARAARGRCCGVCGEPLGVRIAFVGGPRSIENRLFTDLPMHRDCAVFAMQVCPFIAAPKFSYARTGPEGTKISDNITVARPERFGLGITKGFDLARLNGEIVLQARAFETVEWWSHGSPVAA